MIRYKYIFLSLVLFPIVAFTQPVDPFAEDAYEPDSLFAVRNAVKIDPIQIVFGDFQVYYERMLHPHWSLELGFGPTRRNYSASWFSYELDNLGENVDIKTRYAASLSLRYYMWDDEELYGPYLSLGLSHKRYDKSYAVIDTTGLLTGDSFDDSRRFTSLMLFGGYQALGIGSNIFADVYIGVGCRFRSFDIVRTTDLYAPAAYYVDSQRSSVFGFQAGVRIGYGF